MSFPIYKSIRVNSHQKRLIYSQLDQIDFGSNPFIFDLLALAEYQNQAITHIENYFDEHEINNYSYPIVILTDIPNNHSRFYFTSDKKNIPAFFKHRYKQLSTKEEQKLNLVKLKQTHLNNILIDEFQPILDEYAKTHKKIYLLEKQKYFYDQLAKKIGIL